MGKTSREREQQSLKSFEKAWELYKKAWEWMKEIPGALRNTLKWSCQKFDARDKKIWEWIERKERQKGKNTSWKVKRFFRNNILKLLLWAWLLTYWWVEIKQYGHWKQEQKEQTEQTEMAEWTYLEKFWDDDKIFIIDVSENNELDEKKFAKRNEDRRESTKEDVRWVSWVYIRTQKEGWPDKDFQEFYEWVKRYNEAAEHGQQIAIWWYIYFNKASSAITDEWVEDQVDRAISILEIINKEGDGIVDLIPMLDFEYSGKEWDDPWVNSEKWQKSKEAVLKRLQLFEQKTWIIPWIYTWWSIYHDYFLNDTRFAKYPVRIATYNWKRVDQSPDWHSVLIWPIRKTVEYQPDLVQFSDKIKNSWFWTEKWGYLDGSSTTKDKFKWLMIKNADAPTDIDKDLMTDIDGNQTKNG